MSAIRHRRRTTLLRAAAVAAFLAAAGLVAVAVLVESRTGLRYGAAVGGVLVAVLAGALLRSERALPAAVGAARAKQAVGFVASQQVLLGDQRAVVEHLGRLLAEAETRAARLSTTVARLEAERGAAREAAAESERAAQAAATQARTVSQELVRLSDTTLADLWPDLAEAPTVVDLIGWEQRIRESAEDEADRRSA